MSTLAAPTAPALARTRATSDQWIEDFLRPRLEELAGRDERLWLALPAPTAPVERLPALSERGHGVVWDPPEGVSVAGVGAAWKIEPRGADRFRTLRAEADRMLGELRVERHGDALVLAPRVLGGLAFDVGAADGDPWQEFGDGCFSLPRFLYAVDRSGSAMLALAVHGQEVVTETQRSAWIEETRGLLHDLASPTADLGSVGEIVASTLETPGQKTAAPADGPDWIRRVEDIRNAIGAGEVEKIVAARRSEVEIPAGLSVDRVLALLGRDLRASTRFAFCRSRAAFVGVTPERLLAKEGRKIHTEALAGSIERGHAAELLDSGKDRLEQQLVVDSIVRRLEPLCERLQVAARPTVRELRDVLHLHTPIFGRLSEPRHILDLAEMLHPTPAVGGVPTPAAVDWITERETHARGWYSAPIGWFDAEGDGELMVALRSCVLTEEKAYLFVGAGIVADSDPELELQETELKKQALLSALRS